MRSSSVLPSEHVVALMVNLLILTMAVGSAVHLLPALFHNSAKVRLVSRQLGMAQTHVRALEDERSLGQAAVVSTARSQANLVPSSRVSVLWSRP